MSTMTALASGRDPGLSGQTKNLSITCETYSLFTLDDTFTCGYSDLTKNKHKRQINNNEVIQEKSSFFKRRAAVSKTSILAFSKFHHNRINKKKNMN